MSKYQKTGALDSKIRIQII